MKQEEKIYFFPFKPSYPLFQICCLLVPSTKRRSTPPVDFIRGDALQIAL